MPFDTETQVVSWPLAREELAWISPERRGLPPLDVMACRRDGSECTVFIPGLNGKWSTWLPVLQAMSELGVDPGSIFILDFRNTRFPSSVSDLRDVCEHILSFIAAGGYETLNVVGHSTGGCLATFMCTTGNPDVQVSKLFSVSGTFVSLFDAAHLPVLESLRAGGAAKSLARLRLIAKGGPVANLGLRAISTSDQLTRYFLAGLYAHPDEVPSSTLQSNIRSFSVQTLRDTLDIGVAYEYRLVYPKVSVPARLVLGDCDPLVVEQDALTAETLIPRLTHSLLKDTGHFPHLERPIETVRELYEL
jgi:pimeloyl-ACP methyl ester carboxylesterase